MTNRQLSYFRIRGASEAVLYLIVYLAPRTPKATYFRAY